MHKRAHALYAPAKVGKSHLTFEMVAAKAAGHAIYRQPESDPIHVGYLDYEMTDDDVYDRLMEMGYDQSYEDVFKEHLTTGCTRPCRHSTPKKEGRR